MRKACNRLSDILKWTMFFDCPMIYSWICGTDCFILFIKHNKNVKGSFQTQHRFTDSFNCYISYASSKAMRKKNRFQNSWNQIMWQLMMCVIFVPYWNLWIAFNNWHTARPHVVSSTMLCYKVENWFYFIVFFSVKFKLKFFD